MKKSQSNLQVGGLVESPNEIEMQQVKRHAKIGDDRDLEEPERQKERPRIVHAILHIGHPRFLGVDEHWQSDEGQKIARISAVPKGAGEGQREKHSKEIRKTIWYWLDNYIKVHQR